MSVPAQGTALASFYDNLTRVQRDLSYYLNPIGLSRRGAIIALLQAQRSDVIGDLGCGEGLVAVKLRSGGSRIFGCDISPSRARLAVANGIDAVSGDIMRLPYPDRFFDRVVCTEVIEHVINPIAALNEIRRVLDNDGVAVLTVPLDEHLERTLLDIPEAVLASGSYHEIKEEFDLENSHLSSFTENSFQELVRASGFHIEDIMFTYNYTLKRPRFLRVVRKFYFSIARPNPGAALSQFIEALIHPLIFASYEKQDTKHHIVVKAGKSDL